VGETNQKILFETFAASSYNATHVYHLSIFSAVANGLLSLTHTWGTSIIPTPVSKGVYSLERIDEVRRLALWFIRLLID
jgi:hypothetical protein